MKISLANLFSKVAELLPVLCSGCDCCFDGSSSIAWGGTWMRMDKGLRMPVYSCLFKQIWHVEMVNRTWSKGRCHPSGRSSECDNMLVCTAPFCTVGSNDVFPWPSYDTNWWMDDHRWICTWNRLYISKKRIWIRLEPVDGPAVQADVNKQNKDVGFARVKRRLMMMPTYTCHILYLHMNLCIIYFCIPIAIPRSMIHSQVLQWVYLGFLTYFAYLFCGLGFRTSQPAVEYWSSPGWIYPSGGGGGTASSWRGEDPLRKACGRGNLQRERCRKNAPNKDCQKTHHGNTKSHQ